MKTKFVSLWICTASYNCINYVEINVLKVKKVKKKYENIFFYEVIKIMTLFNYSFPSL